MSEEMSRGEMGKPEAYAKIWALIKDTKIAMLTTSNGDGGIHSRPMATQETEFQGELWFLTRQHSSKVDEIQHDSEVNLVYVDSDNKNYVSLSGRAALSKDRARIKELWRPMHKAWFPQGEDDPEITALKVTVDQAEYWSAPSNAVVRNYQILKAAVTQGRSQVGEHQKLSL